jgi:uncharacterized RDD family membrane protein YckC
MSASLFRRLASIFYDTLIILALYVLVGFVIVSIYNITHENNFPGAFPLSISLSIFFSLSVLFYTYFWRSGGQTLGMRAWRIKIINSDTDKPITLTQCLLRCASAFFSIISFGLGYMWLLWDKQEKTWHDHASFTRIIHIPKK